VKQTAVLHLAIPLAKASLSLQEQREMIDSL